MRGIENTPTTRYSCAVPVRFLEHKLHVRPREVHGISSESSGLHTAQPYKITWQRDLCGNPGFEPPILFTIAIT